MKLNDYEAYSNNPFQSALKPSIKLSWRRADPDKATPMVNTDSGEVIFVSNLGNVKLHLKDTAEFTKVFMPACDEIRNLSTPGVRLLLFIFTLIQKDTDWVLIDIKMAMEWCKYGSRAHIYSGLCDLLTYKFISRKTGGTGEYYINPNFFFNGRRTELKYGSELKERTIDRMKRGRLNLSEETNEIETPEE